MKRSFEWSKSEQLSLFKILLAFLLPSSFAFLGFRLVLPFLVHNGYPKVLMWGIVASIMLLVFVIIGVYLNYSESKKLNISLFERLCIKNITVKQWFIYIGLMIIGLALSLLAKPLIDPFMRITGLYAFLA